MSESPVCAGPAPTPECHLSGYQKVSAAVYNWCVRRVGIADLGSNTARLVAFEFEPEIWFRMVGTIREPVRLGEGMARDGRLTRAAVERAMAAVELFEDYAGAVDLDEIEILATSAVRDAANRDEVLGPIRDHGYAVRVLAGEEEAELGVLAAANSFDLDDAWVLDVGGGSAQLSRMQDRRYMGGGAFPLGAVRLTEAFLDSDPPTESQVTSLERFIEERLGDQVARMRESGLPLIAMGGTARNLARLEMKRRRYPLAVMHGYRFSRDGLETIVGELLEMSVTERVDVAGIRPYRADVVVAGALVYRWIVRHAGLDAIEISGHGVREGALYRRFLPSPHLVDDVRRFTIENLAARHREPRGHVDRVRTLSRALFRGLSPLHRLGERELELLIAASVLHDIGTNLDYYRHHRHGAYVLSSVALPGFTHREQALLALLVRYHRKGRPKADDFGLLLGKRDIDMLAQLTACLRMAESLERSRAGRVSNVEVAVDESRILLELTADEPPTVELWEARGHGELFRQAFDRELVVKAID